jgi:hypothetical protein
MQQPTPLWVWNYCHRQKRASYWFGLERVADSSHPKVHALLFSYTLTLFKSFALHALLYKLLTEFSPIRLIAIAQMIRIIMVKNQLRLAALARFETLFVQNRLT